MAIFRDFRKTARLEEEDLATLHFSVVVDEHFEDRAWGALEQSHDALEAEIRDAISALLGPQFTASRLPACFTLGVVSSYG